MPFVLFILKKWNERRERMGRKWNEKGFKNTRWWSSSSEGEMGEEELEILLIWDSSFTVLIPFCNHQLWVKDWRKRNIPSQKRPFCSKLKKGWTSDCGSFVCTSFSTLYTAKRIEDIGNKGEEARLERQQELRGWKLKKSDGGWQKPLRQMIMAVIKNIRRMNEMHYRLLLSPLSPLFPLFLPDAQEEDRHQPKMQVVAAVIWWLLLNHQKEGHHGHHHFSGHILILSAANVTLVTSHDIIIIIVQSRGSYYNLLFLLFLLFHH